MSGNVYSPPGAPSVVCEFCPNCDCTAPPMSEGVGVACCERDVDRDGTCPWHPDGIPPEEGVSDVQRTGPNTFTARLNGFIPVFVPRGDEEGIPIFSAPSGWYYIDRRYEDEVGPFPSEDAARAAARAFVELLTRDAQIAAALVNGVDAEVEGKAPAALATAGDPA